MELENTLKTNNTVVLTKIYSTSIVYFMASYSGRPSSDNEPNGASSPGTKVQCTTTIIKVLQGAVTTSKITFDLELFLKGSDKKRDNPFLVGTNHVLVFRREFQPKNDTTALGFDSWSSRNWWREDSVEGRFIIMSQKK